MKDNFSHSTASTRSKPEQKKIVSLKYLTEITDPAIKENIIFASVEQLQKSKNLLFQISKRERSLKYQPHVPR